MSTTYNEQFFMNLIDLSKVGPMYVETILLDCGVGYRTEGISLASNPISRPSIHTHDQIDNLSLVSLKGHAVPLT